MRSRSSDTDALEPCATVPELAVRYQSAVTRDLGRHALLHADTRQLVGELRALGADTCSETRRFLVTADQTVADLCPDCVANLRRARAPVA